MYGVGIDLGTSFAAAAVGQAGSLEMVRLSDAATVTPSVAYLDDAAGLLTGEAADRLGLADPSRVAREFKRRLGDPTPVLLGGLPYTPAALMAAMLRAILDTVAAERGAPPDHVVLTHPAVWGAYRREHFAAIPRLAGLSQPDPGVGGPTVVTTTEPVAAATYYCSTHPLPPDGLLAVYDLGGGTFDSAVVRNGRNGLEIVGTPEGIEWLGGADFDQAILDQIDRQLGGAITRLERADPSTPLLLAALQRECTRAKEALSTRPQAQVTISLPNGVRQVTIDRDTFEQMISPALDTTVDAFRRTLTASGVTPQELTAVLLVGGSSQIPRVAAVVRDTLRRPILINTHPKHAVALGAAMLSADALARRDAPTTRRFGRHSAPDPAPVSPRPASGPDRALARPTTPATAPAAMATRTATSAATRAAALLRPPRMRQNTGGGRGERARPSGAWWRSARFLTLVAAVVAVLLLLVVLLFIVPKSDGGAAQPGATTSGTTTSGSAAARPPSQSPLSRKQGASPQAKASGSGRALAPSQAAANPPAVMHTTRPAALPNPITVEAENPGNYWYGAGVQDCVSCSGSKRVQYIGAGNCLIVYATVPATGRWRLSITYSSDASRALRITVSGGSSSTITLPGSGGWSTMATTATDMSFSAGRVSIRFDNPQGRAPDIDKITIS